MKCPCPEYRYRYRYRQKRRLQAFLNAILAFVSGLQRTMSSCPVDWRATLQQCRHQKHPRMGFLCRGAEVINCRKAPPETLGLTRRWQRKSISPGQGGQPAPQPEPELKALAGWHHAPGGQIQPNLHLHRRTEPLLPNGKSVRRRRLRGSPKRRARARPTDYWVGLRRRAPRPPRPPLIKATVSEPLPLPWGLPAQLPAQVLLPQVLIIRLGERQEVIAIATMITVAISRTGYIVAGRI